MVIGFNLEEGKSEMAVVKIPAEWIPKCANEGCSTVDRSAKAILIPISLIALAWRAQRHC